MHVYVGAFFHPKIQVLKQQINISCTFHRKMLKHSKVSDLKVIHLIRKQTLKLKSPDLQSSINLPKTLVKQADYRP